MDSYPAIPHPLPRDPVGWFCVGLSHEIKPGGVQPVSCMGRELVLFRTASGAAAVLDAYCVHMGTHLGHGGTIEGECVRCPFHRWGYGTDGTCVDVPYARKIPPQARVRAYPVQERNGAILAWFHPEGAPPYFEVPDFPSEGWSDPAWVDLTFLLHIQEIAENGIDIAHFPVIHGSVRAGLTMMNAREIPFHYLLRTAYDGDGIGVPGREVDVTTDWTYWGIGVFVGQSTADAFGSKVRHIFHCTPVPGDKVRFRTAIGVNLSTVAENLVEFVQQKNIEMTARNLEEDAPIWHHKRYLTRPMLSDGDGPYGLLRRWTRQFYLPVHRSQEPALAAEPMAPDLADEHTDGIYQIRPESVSRIRRAPAARAPEAASVAIDEPGAVPGAVRGIFFEKIPATFNAPAVKRPFVVQYDVAGEGGGAYFIEVDVNRCVPAEGRHASPCVRVSVGAGDWIQINDGRLDSAQAFLSGRLKVDGDFDLAVTLAEIFPVRVQA